MKVTNQNSQELILNLERGEELFETLQAFLEKKGIASGTLTGLGAADSLEIAYYNLETKTYERHQIEEELEILSLTGNLAFFEEKPILHIHGIFGRRDLSTLGGHLFECRISGAGEIHFRPLDTKLRRTFDEPTGLNLLCA